MVILGIDPGSNVCGYGAIVKGVGQKNDFLTCGTLRLKGSQVVRLHDLYEGLRHLTQSIKADVVACEKVFVNVNPWSSLKLGEARGVAIHATTLGYKPFFEYSTNHIKKIVSGYGHANKLQIQFMIRHFLSLNQNPTQDAADALAVAICHAQHVRSNS